ncbi:MAG: hypothetical protein R6X29_07790 [Acidimicrobiia bacterium]
MYRIILPLVLAMGLGLGGNAEGLAPSGEPPASPVILEGAVDPDQQRLVDWAIGRYVAAGLELPPVIIAFSPTDGPCDGNPGLFRDHPAAHIDLCPSGPLDETAARKTILHELAHAWTDAFLSADDRREFMALRGLDVWSGPAAPWELRGTEHAAEALAWALFDGELRMVTIADAGPDDLAAAYRRLTGEDPPAR